MSGRLPVAGCQPGNGQRATGKLVLYFLRLGFTGFGGPIALAGAMQKDLVEDRGWITREEYLRGLALAQLAPGPLAAQLAIYLGWVRGGGTGATLVGLAFVLPSFVIVLGLSWLYIRFQGLSWMQSAFYGVGAAVIAIIGQEFEKELGKGRREPRGVDLQVELLAFLRIRVVGRIVPDPEHLDGEAGRVAGEATIGTISP